MLASDAVVLDEARTGVDAASAAASTRNTRVARNIAVLLVSQLFIWVAGSGLGILLPRYLGDTDVGRLSFAFSLTTLFGVVVVFGADTYLAREVARRPGEIGHLAFNAVLSRVPVLLAAFGAMALFVNALHYPEPTKQLVYVLSIIMGLMLVNGVCVAALQGLERMTLTSAASIIEKIISGVLGVGAVALAGMGMIGYSFVLLAAASVSTSIIVVHFVRVAPPSFRIDFGVWRELFRGGAPFMLWAVALLIYGSVDITMLSIMTRDDVVGWYSTAYRFIGIATFFPSAITAALLPNISNVGVKESRPLIRRCLDIAMLMSVALTVFFFVGASAIIDFLGYPEGFRHTVLLLRILSLHIPLTTFAMVSGSVVIASNRESARTKAGVIAAVVNPILNLAAIPFFAHAYNDGAIGAAITSVIIEVFMTSVMFALVPRGTFHRANLSRFLRSAVAGAVMAALMIAASPGGLLPMAVLGGFGFGVTALLVRAISIGDMTSMIGTVMKRKTASAPAS